MYSSTESIVSNAHTRGGTSPPCYIIARDLPTWTLHTARQVHRLGFYPVILDMGSTAPGMATMPSNVGVACSVYKLKNHGPYYLWTAGIAPKLHGWWAVTDCDLDLSHIPGDFLSVAQDAYLNNPSVYKVGPSLEILDVPPDSYSTGKIADYEPRYWTKPSHDGHWIAGIDTTFGLYHSSRPTSMPGESRFYEGVRLARPYTARHLPWYYTPSTPPDAEYMDYLRNHAGPSVFSEMLKKTFGV